MKKIKTNNKNAKFVSERLKNTVEGQGSHLAHRGPNISISISQYLNLNISGLQ